MSERRDHAFVIPREHMFRMAYNGFRRDLHVLAEDGDTRLVAQLCFMSYYAGQGRKIIMRNHRKLD
jgi:hypothetical protein